MGPVGGERTKVYGILSYLDVEEGGTTDGIDKEHSAEIKLHGIHIRQRYEVGNVDFVKSIQWLEQCHLRFERDRLLCAAQNRHYTPNI